MVKRLVIQTFTFAVFPILVLLDYNISEDAPRVALRSLVISVPSMPKQAPQSMLSPDNSSRVIFDIVFGTNLGLLPGITLLATHPFLRPLSPGFNNRHPFTWMEN